LTFKRQLTSNSPSFLQLHQINHFPIHRSKDKLNWIVQCFTWPSTQYRLYGSRFLQDKRPNQQYQSTEGRSTKEQSKERKQL